MSKVLIKVWESFSRQLFQRPPLGIVVAGKGTVVLAQYSTLVPSAFFDIIVLKSPLLCP